MHLEMKNRRIVLNALFFILAVVIASTFVYLARYALPKTDDFPNLFYGMQEFEQTGDASAAAYQEMIIGYNNRQGTFFSGFIATFLLLKIGSDFYKFRCVVMLLTALFFVGYTFMVLTAARYFRLKNIWGALLLGVLWIAMDRVGPGETLMFLTGLAVYGIPLTLCFIGVACYMLLLESKRIIPMIVLSLATMLSAFLAGGGVLMVAALTNILMVLLFIHRWFVRRRFPVRGILPFLCAFGSALANALAPGNFMRYQAEAGTEGAIPNIGSTLVNSLGVTLEQIGKLFSHTYILVALAVIAVLILLNKQELDDKEYRVNPLFFFVGAFVTVYIVVFPAALGYDMVPHGYIQDRTVFTIAQAATIGIFIAWTYLWCWIKAHSVIAWSNYTVSCVISVALILVCIGLNIFYIPKAREEGDKPTLALIAEEITTGSIKEYYASYYLALNSALLTSPEQPCYVWYEIPESRLFVNSHLSSAPEWWVNSSIANVYGTQYFAYCPNHEFTEADAKEQGTTIEEVQP